MGCCSITSKILLIIFSAVFIIVEVAVMFLVSDAGTYVSSVFGIIAGCLGIFVAIRNDKIALYITIGVVVVALSLFIYYATVTAAFVQEMMELQSGKHSNPIEKMEIKYKCCGAKGPSTYVEEGKKIPNSCYPKGKENRPDALYQKGCEEYKDSFKNDMMMEAAAAVIPLAGSIFFLIFSSIYLLVLLLCKTGEAQG